MNVIVCGFIVHLIFLFSIFDIYFKSPIVHDIESHSSPLQPPARRLVLFLADGLRADKFYNDNFYNVPYLRYIIQTSGSWGVSHTRVPTESRPGHVAIIAGLYEDPSAVAKGWKENPVEFDSLFNQSQFTWSWGSPDILPMFAKGASGNHVFMEMYDPDMEDFSGSRSTIFLDKWVFDKVTSFFKSAENNSDLYIKLQSDKIVFFLHLLGLDTAGHSHKPHAPEYLKNIVFVDEEIKKIVKLIDEFYPDNKTVYIFTSDHGMTDWGSHGAGHTSETETPLVAWGAGISGPITSTLDSARIQQKDVQQADIAPLMATLIGSPIPVNSVGRIPHSYLNLSDYELSEAMFANARQMLSQYNRKQALVESGILSLLHKPFPLLTKVMEDKIILEVANNIRNMEYTKAIYLCDELITLCLQGSEYYQNYYQPFLLACTTIAFLGWIVLLICKLISGERNYNEVPLSSSANICGSIPTKDLYLHQRVSIFFEVGGFTMNACFFILMVTSLLLIYIQDLPVAFYIHVLLPELLWWAVVRKKYSILEYFRSKRNVLTCKNIIFKILFYVVGIEILVLSFFYRFVMSIGMLMVMFWPFIMYRKNPKIELSLMWFTSSMLLAVFPLLPVVGSEPNNKLIVISGYAAIFLACYGWYTFGLLNEQKKTIYSSIVQLIVLISAVWNVRSVSLSIEAKNGLQILNQLLSWISLVLSMTLPFFGSERIMLRLQSVIISLSVPFILLSASHEVLFLLILTMNMFSWLALENFALRQMKLADVKFSDILECGRNLYTNIPSEIRQAFLFLFYIILSFFGIGNIASLNSFDPTWVRCFVTIFSPFLMSALILWKTVLPFLAVTCFFRAINAIVGVPKERMFILVLIFCDIMGMHFLHLVTNKGSWLEIGSSISHFVIIQAITLILMLMYGLATVLTSVTVWPAISGMKTERFSVTKEKNNFYKTRQSQNISIPSVSNKPKYKKYVE